MSGDPDHPSRRGHRLGPDSFRTRSHSGRPPEVDYSLVLFRTQSLWVTLNRVSLCKGVKQGTYTVYIGERERERHTNTLNSLHYLIIDRTSEKILNSTESIVLETLKRTIIIIFIYLQNKLKIK